MFELENGKLIEKFELPYKYSPKDFIYSPLSEEWYFICRSYMRIDRFSQNGKYLDTIFKGDIQNDSLEYISISQNGTIYCSSPSNNKVYRIRKIEE
ncbi:MAG: hypothetical protein KAX49_13610 [Halanaerobiales bacterium]|nr:hypothetical protein [Halanaerobiales bacterium]